MITSILFDMDGVLINSQPMHYQADLQTLAHFGCRISMQELQKYAGTTNKERYSLFKDRFGLTCTVDTLVSFRENAIMEIFAAMDIQPIPGIRPLLLDIREHKLKTAVASASSDQLIDFVLDKLKLRPYFDLTVSGEGLKNSKPAPDIFLRTAYLLGSDACECVVIEDSANGVLAARAAHMKVLGFRNPDSGMQDLTPADRVITDFLEIGAADLLAIG